VTIEVNLKEGDEEPEQHLDEGEFIERRIVPISELYSTLQGKSCLSSPRAVPETACTQRYRRRRARSWTPGKPVHTRRDYGILMSSEALPLGPRSSLEPTHLCKELTCTPLTGRFREARLCARHLHGICSVRMALGWQAARVAHFEPKSHAEAHRSKAVYRSAPRLTNSVSVSVNMTADVGWMHNTAVGLKKTFRSPLLRTFGAGLIHF
jgi:hypothetical protein